jgi:ANTAR domain-containing protein
MPGSDLSELLDFGAASDARSLHQLASAAAQSVAGCCAAKVVLWAGSEPVLIAATHPDLPRLVDVQLAAGRGPVLDAMAPEAEPVSCQDTLGNERWPEYAAAALLVGVRCSLSFAQLAKTGAVSLTLFGIRPRSIDPRRAQSAEMLGALGGAILGAVSQYDDARRTASQLKDAAEARAVVDQAKGILMHAFGCTADEALARMRQTSQRRNVRALDVAKEIVASGVKTRQGSAGVGRTAAN